MFRVLPSAVDRRDSRGDGSQHRRGHAGPNGRAPREDLRRHAACLPRGDGPRPRASRGVDDEPSEGSPRTRSRRCGSNGRRRDGTANLRHFPRKPAIPMVSELNRPISSSAMRLSAGRKWFLPCFICRQRGSVVQLCLLKRCSIASRSSFPTSSQRSGPACSSSSQGDPASEEEGRPPHGPQSLWVDCCHLPRAPASGSRRCRCRRCCVRAGQPTGALRGSVDQHQLAGEPGGLAELDVAGQQRHVQHRGQRDVEPVVEGDGVS